MTNDEIEKIKEEYEEYCKRDKYPLPFITWLKFKINIQLSDYYTPVSKSEIQAHKRR